MSNEAASGSAETPDGGRHCPGGGEECPPLQTRAAFLANWDWLAVTGINRRACARGGAQHGINTETQEACAAEWEALRQSEISLGGTLDSLRGFHRKAPFLFFNGNTFSSIGRELALALFSDLPPGRKREVSSAVAHYIAGVLDHEAMAGIVESLCAAASLKVGDRVKTLRGSLRGIIVRVLDDGRVVWRPDGTNTELTGLPESLALEG